MRSILLTKMISASNGVDGVGSGSSPSSKRIEADRLQNHELWNSLAYSLRDGVAGQQDERKGHRAHDGMDDQADVPQLSDLLVLLPRRKVVATTSVSAQSSELCSSPESNSPTTLHGSPSRSSVEPIDVCANSRAASLPTMSGAILEQ